MMNDDDLKKYFARLMPDNGDFSREDLEIFKRLMELTLQYRDQLAAESGEILSVRETQVAIEIYWLTLKKGHMKANLDSKIEGLVKLWLREINNLTFKQSNDENE